MVCNSFLGSREICEMMLDHTAARYLLSSKKMTIAHGIGHHIIRIFGYPLNSGKRCSVRTMFKWISSYLTPNDLVLDAGCSFGVYGFELARRGYRVIGIDINRESVTLAQGINNALGIHNVSFHLQDLLSIGFPKGTFDAIIMTEVLHHIKEDDLVIRELCRVLKVGGFLFIIAPHVKRMEEYAKPIPALKIKKRKGAYASRGGIHSRIGYNLSSLNSLLQENGFVVIDHNYTSLPKLTSKDLLRRRILFPLAYSLSLIFGRFSRNRLYLNVIARKTKKLPRSAKLLQI